MEQKKLFKSALFASGLIASAAGICADGTINITGTISAAGCTINAGTSDIALHIPASFIADYTAAGQEGTSSDAGALSLTACPSADTSVAITVSGTADDIDSSLFKLGNDSASGGASGIGLKLVLGGDNITPNTATQYYAVADLGDGTYGWSKDFVVTPVSTSATVTAGTLDTSVTYSLAYN